LCHHHQRRAQQAAVQDIAFLEHLHHVTRRHIARRGLADRLMVFGVERLARRVYYREAVFTGDFDELLAGQFQPFAHGTFAIAQRGKTGIETVKHRQKIAQEALIGELACVFGLAGQAFALVFKVGAVDQHLRAQLFEFRRQRFNLRLKIRRGLGGLSGGGVAWEGVVLGFGIHAIAGVVTSAGVMSGGAVSPIQVRTPTINGMLTHLSIRDFAVVQEAELDFGPGLTVISGETGAGKSLLVDALGFLSGQRADAGVVRHGSERAELSAEFTLAADSAVHHWLREAELDEEGTCTLRRTLRADGGSRAYINGRAVTLGQLSELAGLLVEIHGQHEHQALLDRARQLDLLDAWARHPELLAAVHAAAIHWRALLDEQGRLTRAGDVSERLDWLRHQLGELDAEALDPAAISDLETRHRRHAHAAGLIAACESALAQLAGEDGPSLARQLTRIRSELAREQHHEPRLAEIDAMLESAHIQLEEAAPALQRIRDELDLDPAEFQDLDARLTRLHDLARKHRVEMSQLTRVRDDFQHEHDALVDAGQRLSTLATELANARSAWGDAAAALSASRQRAAASLSQATSALMDELGMRGGRFEVAFSAQGDARPDALGAERVEFLISSNPGQPPRALRKVASGGELSRISLAIEVAALGLDAVQTMVFDEVDSGIGGAVADTVGRKLRALGRERQVLCVTHLPQVAAQGHIHYHVSKAAEGGVTQSEAAVLTGNARITEVARMLGGADISKEARAAARRLLSDVV